jgi:hypothetical protein
MLDWLKHAIAWVCLFLSESKRIPSGQRILAIALNYLEHKKEHYLEQKENRAENKIRISCGGGICRKV